MDVRLPDGTIIQGVPDGTTKADLAAKLQRNGVAVPSEWLAAAPAPSAAESVGSSLRDIPRQVGLTARYGLEGLGRAAEVVTEPLRQIVVNPLLSVTGLPPAASTGDAATSLANAVGLPAPATANERVIGDAARTVASASAFGGVAGAAARGATGATQNVLQQLAARPGMQAAGAATAGAAGGSVREAGGGPGEQFTAALIGGVAGGVGADKLGGATRVAGRMLTPQSVQVQQADQQIQLVLQRAGVDWSQVPERIRQGMRAEVAAALTSGQPLNADAVRRLLVMQRAGVTPTVGMLTQEPGQITREMNLAKTGANSTDPGLQRLPALQNTNTATLLRQLDDMGAAGAPGAMDAGRSVIGTLETRAANAQGDINSLYAAARDTSGRSLPLEGGAFTARANQLLDEAMVGGALPPGVAATMNKIAGGEIPLTVEIAEQLKTQMGKLQRASSDGQTRYALGLVRQALDDAPLQNAGRGVNPGNLPAVPGTVPPSVAAGDESIAAFNTARRANREWMARVESNPALKAVVDGVEPDQFVQRFVVGKGATAADVRALRGELSPQAAESVRQYLTRYLRDAATGGTDDIVKFSNSAYRRALASIGDDKLAAFFDRDQLALLKDVGEAAKLMQAQPAGTAVNNSNSGALLLGRGLDMLSAASSKLPLGLKDTISGTLQGIQQTRVLSPRNALVTPLPAAPPGLRLNPLLAGTVAAPVDASQNDRRH